MIQILKASAGSGKTYNLAREYIRLLLTKKDPQAYRHILAVTFTNKATDEMKRRILDELFTLATEPAKSPYIVDYKTGKVEQEDIDIDDGNAEAVVEKLFGPKNAGRPKIALQLFIYGLLVKEVDNLRDRPVVNSIYSVSRLFTEPLEDRPAKAEFARLTRERLRDLFAEMTDPSVPFRRTEERKTCEYCDFKMICGR